MPLIILAPYLIASCSSLLKIIIVPQVHISSKFQMFIPCAIHFRFTFRDTKLRDHIGQCRIDIVVLSKLLHALEQHSIASAAYQNSIALRSCIRIDTVVINNDLDQFLIELISARSTDFFQVVGPILQFFEHRAAIQF